MSNHSDLRDHVFVKIYDRNQDIDGLRCTVCNYYILADVINEFGIDINELFIMDHVPNKTGEVPHLQHEPASLNYRAISDTVKGKYVPAFAENLSESSSVLSLLQEEMKIAERKMKVNLGKNLFGPPKIEEMDEQEYDEYLDGVREQNAELMNPQGFGPKYKFN